MEFVTRKIHLRTSVLVLLIIAVASIRLIPHIPNFSPFAAIGLFGVSHFQKRWQAFCAPMLAIWISDLIIETSEKLLRYIKTF